MPTFLFPLHNSKEPNVAKLYENSWLTEFESNFIKNKEELAKSIPQEKHFFVPLFTLMSIRGHKMKRRRIKMHSEWKEIT